MHSEDLKDVACGDDSLMDPVDVLRGLAHCEVMLEWLTTARTERLRRSSGGYASAALQHLRELGHELAHGCCSGDAQRVA